MLNRLHKWLTIVEWIRVDKKLDYTVKISHFGLDFFTRRYTGLFLLLISRESCGITVVTNANFDFGSTAIIPWLGGLLERVDRDVEWSPDVYLLVGVPRVMGAVKELKGILTLWQLGYRWKYWVNDKPEHVINHLWKQIGDEIIWYA